MSLFFLDMKIIEFHFHIIVFHNTENHAKGTFLLLAPRCLYFVITIEYHQKIVVRDHFQRQEYRLYLFHLVKLSA